MTAVFQQVVNMSITAGIAVVCVLLGRLVLRRGPGIFSYVLWSVVLFRALCPVSLSMDFSLLSLGNVPVAQVEGQFSRVDFAVGSDGWSGWKELPEEDVPDFDQEAVEENFLPALWFCGVAAVAAWELWSCVRLKKQLQEAVPAEAGVWEADGLDTAFALGLFRPRIYIPSGLPENRREYMLLHERQHLRRLDPLWKALGFCAVCLHWFNPLIWLAFILAERDMERSCDEAVAMKLNPAGRREYARTLAEAGAGRRCVALPLAFGEGNVKERVRNVLNWRKTPVWGKGLCLLLCGVLLAACAGNPGETVSGGDVLLTEPANPQLEAYDREKDELGQELDRLQNRFQEATRPVTELPNAVVAKMELTAYANMEVSLPADWAYTLVDYTGGEEPCGIRFWPKECPGAAMGLYYYPQGFGICGNETMTVAMQVDENGEIVNLIGTLGYENGSDCILFCSYSEYFAAVSEGISNFPEYQKDLLGILGSVVLNRGCLTEQEALECLRKQSLIREDWDVYQCKYDPQTGEWCFRFYAEESDSNPQKELYVGPDGTCRYAGERHRESGHHHGH